MLVRFLAIAVLISSAGDLPETSGLNAAPADVDSAKRDSSSARFADAASRIDGMLRAKWQADNVQPAERGRDAEFCRRVWLDLAGVAPPVWQLRLFLADPAPDKRQRLIERLLQSSRFAVHMANRWNDFLLPADSDAGLADRSAALKQWLRDQFQRNTPYDHLVGGFLTAGGTNEDGPAIFYTSREADPVKLAAATSRLFLGIQLKCAQCHDHPFSAWTQDDFWSFVAFYSQVELDDAGNPARATIRDRRGKQVQFPETDRVMQPRYPGVDHPPEPDPADFRRRQLTIWLASRDNPYFARAAANRVWAHLFGRGLVDPIDDMDVDNPPSHPEVLQYLADYLVHHRFDLRALYRMLASTDAYSLSSGYGTADRPRWDSFAVMSVKTLSAAQFFDTLRQNVYLGVKPNSAGMNAAPGASANPIRAQFLMRMQSAQALPTEYPHGVVQSLGLMNGPEMQRAVSPQQSGLIGSLDAPFLSDAERIEALFLACLSRPPTDDEMQRFGLLLSRRDSGLTRKERLSDLVWVLLNTAECFVCP